MNAEAIQYKYNTFKGNTYQLKYWKQISWIIKCKFSKRNVILELPDIYLIKFVCLLVKMIAIKKFHQYKIGCGHAHDFTTLQ